MGNNKRLPSGDLRRRLAARPARPAPAATLAGEDDAVLLRQALAGVTALPPVNRAEIEAPRPAPQPRPRRAANAVEETPAPAAKANPLDLPKHWFDGEQPLARGSDESVLRAALQGINPIRHTRIELETPKPRPHPIQHERDEQAALAESIYAPTPLELRLEGGDELYYLKEGTPRSVLRDLRRGRWVVEAQIDLHGATRDQARDILAEAMAQWRKRGVRTVRIIHGKGLGSPGKDPVLKKLVAGWLMNYDDVVAYCQARVHDGGAGALIVLLRATRR